MKIVAYSVGIRRAAWQFGTHISWTVYEFGLEGAFQKAKDHKLFLDEHYPKDEAKILALFGNQFHDAPD